MYIYEILSCATAKCMAGRIFPPGRSLDTTVLKASKGVVLCAYFHFLFRLNLSWVPSSVGHGGSHRGEEKHENIREQNSERAKTDQASAESFTEVSHVQVGSGGSVWWNMFSWTPAHAGVFAACSRVSLSRHGHPHCFLSKVR